jgi:hypothetical protein
MRPLRTKILVAFEKSVAVVTDFSTSEDAGKTDAFPMGAEADFQRGFPYSRFSA